MQLVHVERERERNMLMDTWFRSVIIVHTQVAELMEFFCELVNLIYKSESVSMLFFCRGRFVVLYGICHKT